jgi:hypothetical protein
MKQTITIRVNAEVGTEPKQVNAIVRPSGLAIILVESPYQRLTHSYDSTVKFRTGAMVTHVASGESLLPVHSLRNAELACKVLEAFPIDWHIPAEKLLLAHPILLDAIATASFAHGREMFRMRTAGKDTRCCQLEEI